MNKKINLCYIFITIIFFFLTLYEIKVYLTTNSNLFGLIYLFLNFFIAFVLFTLTYNFKHGNVKIRVSKNIIVVFLGLFASFILTLLVPVLLSYTDESYVFNDSVFLISKVFKPILYILLVGLSILEIKILRRKK